MHLVLFDIDGTLTQSQSIDAEIYLHSLSEVFGFADVDPDWSSYRHTTDSGILHEIFESRLGRTPAAAEISTFRAHFVDAIAVAAARTPFREIIFCFSGLQTTARKLRRPSFGSPRDLDDPRSMAGGHQEPDEVAAGDGGRHGVDQRMIVEQWLFHHRLIILGTAPADTLKRFYDITGDTLTLKFPPGRNQQGQEIRTEVTLKRISGEKEMLP